MNKIEKIISYRFMLYNLLKQDLFGKYKHSALGVLWVLINPILQLLVYFVIFKYVFNIQIENYAIYLFIGIMGWQILASSITNGTNIITDSFQIVKKIYFPREILPLTIVIGNIINYIIVLPIIIIALIISGIGISINIVLLPIILIVQAIFTYALTLLFSAINVYARDTNQIAKNLLFVWMYLTPIVYTKEMVPSAFHIIYNLNPMVHIIEAYRDILYNKQCINFFNVGIVLLISIIILVISQCIFNKLNRRFAEEL